MSENTREEIALILQNNTAWCPQAGCYIIHGAIEKIMEKVDQEKRSTAIAFLNAVTEDGCSNYFRVGDEWFLGDPDEEDGAEGPFTTEQVYDQYIQSLPKTV